MFKLIKAIFKAIFGDLFIGRKGRCKVCGVEYAMGYNGTADDLCDRDAGVKRDRKGRIVFEKHFSSRQAK